jgi:diacylglycerol kinase (ATP)
LKKSLLIYNPAAASGSGKRERQVTAAAQELTRSGLHAELTATSGPGSATGLAREAAGAGYSLVLACGGDGTINEVANGLAGTETVLGILPGGTANILAKELGLPHDPVEAARQLNSWQARRIALGKATWRDEAAGGESRTKQRYFVCVAGTGFDAYVLHKLARSLAAQFGVAAYGWEAIRQLLRYSFPRFIAEINGREVRATFAAAQRASRYAGWVRMAPRRDFFAPGLTVCLFKSSRRSRYLTYALAVMRGRHARLGDVEEIEATRVHLAAEDGHPPIYFELDGELAGCLPVTLEVVPEALTLLAPMPSRQPVTDSETMP